MIYHHGYQYSPSKDWQESILVLWQSANDKALFDALDSAFSYIFLFIWDNLSAIAILADPEAGKWYLC